MSNATRKVRRYGIESAHGFGKKRARAARFAAMVRDEARKSGLEVLSMRRAPRDMKAPIRVPCRSP